MPLIYKSIDLKHFLINLNSVQALVEVNMQKPVNELLFIHWDLGVLLFTSK